MKFVIFVFTILVAVGSAQAAGVVTVQVRAASCTSYGDPASIVYQEIYRNLMAQATERCRSIGRAPEIRPIYKEYRCERQASGERSVAVFTGSASYACIYW